MVVRSVNKRYGVGFQVKTLNLCFGVLDGSKLNYSGEPSILFQIILLFKFL